MKYVFLENSGKLRSGWRAAFFLAVFFLVYALFGILAVPYSLYFHSEDYWVKMHFLTLNSAFLLIISLLLGGIAARIFEGLPFRSLGASCIGNWLKHFLWGNVMGALTLTVAVIIAFIFGGERFELNLSGGTGAVIKSLLISFFVFAIAAAFEESLFRGYILQTFARSGLAWFAILLTSVVFGVVHFGNPNATAISTLNTILAGIWFSIAYMRTRDLWFVWGLHLMWNWMQGSFFGIEVSGLTDITPMPLLKEIDTGPTWLTGTTYGIEGGVACTFALIVSMALIYYLPNLKPDKEMLALSEPPA